MRRPLAVVFTFALLAGAFYVGRGRSISDGKRVGQASDSPARCLERMFSAAEQGDVAAWLDCFTGTQRAAFAKEIDANPTQEFAESLKKAVGEIKGRAVSGTNASDSAGAVATLSVERVYAHHTERQSYHFRRDADGWRIESLGSVEKRQPAIPYGTPVFELGETPQDHSAVSQANQTAR
ncbi:MAG TPA: hypothetical protein VFI31_05090 [Pirellulales bacterium]|nr:hypothetical protein [Pirellulales bacterium]